MYAPTLWWLAVRLFSTDHTDHARRFVLACNLLLHVCLQESFSRIALGKFYESHERLKAVMSAMNGGTCGVCKDCNETFAGSGSIKPRAAVGRRLQVHCFEPSATNFAALSEMHKRFFGSSNTTARGNELRLYNAAMSNYTGTVEMPSNCGELCQVSSVASTTVPLTTWLSGRRLNTAAACICRSYLLLHLCRFKAHPAAQYQPRIATAAALQPHRCP
jgi:hypothetical protein